jgi:hypothetical protein
MPVPAGAVSLSRVGVVHILAALLALTLDHQAAGMHVCTFVVLSLNPEPILSL